MTRGRKVFIERFPSDTYRRPSGPLWQPAVDVYRCPEGWKIKFDLAGVRPEDIEVSMSGDSLIVRGVRRDLIMGEGWSYYQLEITYSRFERVLQIPCDLSHAEVRSEYKDGWFILHISNCFLEEGKQNER
jgi:HSP20 family protein